MKFMYSQINKEGFFSFLFQNFTLFRKYYTMVMEIIYKYMQDSIKDNQYEQAQNYLYCYFSCINYLITKKVVPNENLMQIIKKFNEVDVLALYPKGDTSSTTKIEKENNNNLNKQKFKSEYVYIYNNFAKTGFIKENIMIERLNKLDENCSLQIDGGKKIIKPKIKFNNGNVVYECSLWNQAKVLSELNKQYSIFCKNGLNLKSLNIWTLFTCCLNVLLFIRSNDHFKSIACEDIDEAIKTIITVYLNLLSNSKEKII